jgi:3-oxoacyl-[acyl-carrier-protein] synthase III
MTLSLRISLEHRKEISVMRDTLPFPYAIVGVAADHGRVLPIEDWADIARLPNRNKPGAHLSGEDLRRIFGVHGKSYDPDRFRNLDAIAEVAAEALDSAQLRPSDLDGFIVATGSSYEARIDQDSFTLARLLRLPDPVPTIQMGTGCAGLARAAALTARNRYQNVLIVTYFITSVIMFDADGELSPVYRTAGDAPLVTWASPATFSDAAAAMVLTRADDADGVVLYSRDALAFGEGPGLADPLVHYREDAVPDTWTSPPGRGHPGRYCMNPPEIRRYYPEGMMLNHHTLTAADPHYPDGIRRIYTHQAGPVMVQDFVQAAGLDPDKVPSNVAQIGNTVSASTLVMLEDDLKGKVVTTGDRVCFSVVGSGPERGAFTAPLRLCDVER